MNYYQFKSNIENNLDNPEEVNKLLKNVVVDVIGAELFKYTITYENKQIKIDADLEFEVEIEHAVIWVTLADMLSSLGQRYSVHGYEDDKYKYMVTFEFADN